MSGETPLVFECRGEPLVGILHRPAAGAGIGVLLVVGGPQYRVGSHRQFVLLARRLAESGYPVLRFDCRGMGDSGGGFPGFEQIAPDISAAADVLCAQANVQRFVLWGLCDAAAAALMYAPGDRRVAGLVLLNPWVRTEATLARTTLRHYYLARLASRDFWQKLLRGRLRPARALVNLAGNLRAGAAGAGEAGDFVARMLGGLEAFAGSVLVILSGNDLTAAEFADLATRPAWQAAFSREGVTRCTLQGANHTFASEAWRNEVAELTLRHLRALGGPAPGGGAVCDVVAAHTRG